MPGYFVPLKVFRGCYFCLYLRSQSSNDYSKNNND